MRSLLFAVLSLVVFSDVAAENQNVWQIFVREPSEANYKICEDQIKDSLSGRYKQFQSPTFSQLMESSLGKVLALVESGNIYASHLCFQFFPLFDGYPDIQEHINVSRGRLIKVNPQLFVELLAKYQKVSEMTDADLGTILGNYGDEYVDEWEKKVQETKERIEALKRSKGYEDIRSRCIHVLEQKLARMLQ
jgi:hypothetical protein